MFKFYSFIFLFLCVFSVALAGTTLTKNLYQGIKDPEVIILQKFLNTSSDTLVSTTDSGSIGLETDYFGAKTKDAVIRFQNKYASEILAPIGLFYGTGYVGSLTRQKINSLLIVSSNPVIGTTVTTLPLQIITTTTATTTATSTIPKITKISPEVLDDGDTLTIYGTGFTASNTVFLSIEAPDKYLNIPSTANGTKISFPIETLLGETVMTGFQNNLSHLSSDARSQVIEKLLIGYRVDNNQEESSEREMLVPAILRVENENGKSDNVTISINIFKEIF